MSNKETRPQIASSPKKVVKKETIKIVIDGKEKTFSSEEEALAYIKKHKPEIYEELSKDIRAKSSSDDGEGLRIDSTKKFVLNIKEDGETKRLVFDSFEEYKKYIREHYPEAYEKMERDGAFSRKAPSDLFAKKNELQNFLKSVLEQLKYKKEISEEEIKSMAALAGLPYNKELETTLKLMGFVKKRKGFLGLFGEAYYTLKRRKKT